MKNLKISTLLTFAQIICFSSFSSLAAAPGGFSFGNFSVGAGDSITLGPCPTTGSTSCAADPKLDTGFMQRQITDESGKTYIQTIIAEGADGAATTFRAEDFIVIGAVGNSGISSRQSIVDTSDANANFVNSAAIDKGVFKTSADNLVDIRNNISGKSTSAGFGSHFIYVQRNAAKQYITIDQGVDFNNSPASQEQQFSYIHVQGSELDGNPIESSQATLQGKTITIEPGDIVDRIQLNQSGAATGTFGFEAIRDLSDTPSRVFGVSFLDTPGLAGGTWATYQSTDWLPGDTEGSHTLLYDPVTGEPIPGNDPFTP